MNFFTKNFSLLFMAIILFGGCKESPKTLPILGERSFVKGDTLYHTIPNFAFIDQNGTSVTNETFENKIYVADFFFTTCPTICPKMKTQLLRVYGKYKENSAVGILSHTIDPHRDSVQVLRDYAQRLGIADNKMWHFVTGDQAKIFEIGEKQYMVTTKADSTDKENGGYIHSGAFLLIDKHRRVRGMYDGTKAEAVNKLMNDMDVLLAEK